MRASLAPWLLVGIMALGCKAETPRPGPDASVAQPHGAAEAEGPAGSATHGHWVGSISLPGSQSLDWAVAVQPDSDGDGLAEAKLWIPAQMVSGAELGPPSVAADGAMSVELVGVGARWTIDPGPAATCEFEQRGLTFPCSVSSSEFEDFAKLAEPPRPQTPKPPFPYAVEDLKIVNASAGEGPDQAPAVTLAATLTIPAGPGPHPGVVLISGSGQQDRDETLANHKPFWLIADQLSRAGVAVLRYDDRGFGESTGDVSEATLEDFATDAWAAAEALAARPEIDGERVGLIGHSEGGVIAPLVATQHPEAIDFLVLLAGTGVTGSELIIRQQTLLLEAQGIDQAAIDRAEATGRQLHAAVLDTPPDQAAAVLAELLRGAVAEQAEPGAPAPGDAALAAQIEVLTSPWFRHFLAWDPAPILAKLDQPVLVMIGDMDLQVDVEQNLAPMQAALKANARAEFVLLPGLNHLFQPAQRGTPDEYGLIEMTMEPAVLDELARWIGVTTGLREPAQ